jgi:hypothetical protein
LFPAQARLAVFRNRHFLNDCGKFLGLPREYFELPLNRLESAKNSIGDFTLANFVACSTAALMLALVNSDLLT